MAPGGQVIRAAQMFTKTGQASKISVTKEIVYGSILGLAFGAVWQAYHWNEDKKWQN